MNNRSWQVAAITFFIGLRRQVKLLESQLADINDVLRESDPNQPWKAE